MSARGERGTTVVYADRFTPDDERRRAAETGEQAQAIPFLKRFTVFNTAQCEGLPDEMMAMAPPVETDLVLPQAEALIRATGGGFQDRRWSGPSTIRGMISCRCRPRRPISSRSTGIGPPFTKSATPAAIPPASTAI